MHGLVLVLQRLTIITVFQSCHILNDKNQVYKIIILIHLVFIIYGLHIIQIDTVYQDLILDGLT